VVHGLTRGRVDDDGKTINAINSPKCAKKAVAKMPRRHPHPLLFLIDRLITIIYSHSNMKSVQYIVNTICDGPSTIQVACK
jgi:hypothetical protein